MELCAGVERTFFDACLGQNQKKETFCSNYTLRLIPKGEETLIAGRPVCQQLGHGCVQPVEQERSSNLLKRYLEIDILLHFYPMEYNCFDKVILKL